MAIFLANLALRRAPVATTTIRTQCRGLQIRRPVATRSKPFKAVDENVEGVRFEQATKVYRKRQAVTNGAQEEKTTIPAQISYIHRVKTLPITRQIGDQEEPPPIIPARVRKQRRDPIEAHGENPPVLAAGRKLRKFQALHIERSQASEKQAFKALKQESNIDAMMVPMFSPTSPRKAKASTRRHLDSQILIELLGEPSTAPAKPTIPPLKLKPESFGLPPDVSWRPLAEKDQTSFLHSDHIQTGAAASEPLLERLRDTATVIVLSCASRTLALSDFIRLSPQGEHIEGWTSGIVRVIPGRNPATLERSNHYFLVFSTAAAAAGYAENIDRIHKMSQKWTPDKPQHSGVPAPGIEMGKLGEDVGGLVRSYTLSPNTQPRVYMRRLQKPYRPAIARVIETGAYHNILAQGKDRPGENLVLFQLDDGLMSGSDLLKVIEADGRRRNLNWRLEGNTEGDILQFGGGGKNDASQSDDRRENEEGEDRESDDKERRKRKSSSNAAVFPRHIVRFRDAVEAKRFVRAWHCKILEGEPWDKLSEKGQWAGGKVSAEILW